MHLWNFSLMYTVTLQLYWWKRLLRFLFRCQQKRSEHKVWQYNALGFFHIIITSLVLWHPTGNRFHGLLTRRERRRGGCRRSVFFLPEKKCQKEAGFHKTRASVQQQICSNVKWCRGSDHPLQRWDMHWYLKITKYVFRCSPSFCNLPLVWLQRKYSDPQRPLSWVKNLHYHLEARDMTSSLHVLAARGHEL